MHTQVTNGQLSIAIASILTDPFNLQIGGQEKFEAFCTDLAQLLCKYCGGEVIEPAKYEYGTQSLDWATHYVVKINPGDSKLWKKPDPTSDHGKVFVIYSANESAVSDGAGFWSNKDGWTELQGATKFVEAELSDTPMPISTGADAKWVLFDEAEKSYGGLSSMKDAGLTAEQLDDKYNPEGDGEHPEHTRADWRWAVANEDTLCGYWDWVVKMIDEAASMMEQPPEVLPGATAEEIQSVAMQDIVGDYDTPEQVPEWKWVEENATFWHRNNGTDGIWEFVLNLSRQFEAIPEKLQPVIKSAVAKGFAYLIIHQGT